MTQGRHLTALAPTVCEALGLPRPAGATDDALGRASLPEGFYRAERVLILVLDSWGELNWQRAKGHTPYLAELDAAHRVGTLLAVLPSITPVNFTSLGTGAAPEVHGVRERYGRPAVETLFEVARRAGKRTSVVGPDDSSSVLLLGPTAEGCLKAQAKADSNAEVALMLVTHLASERPHLVLSQWLDLDTVGHKVGPLEPDHLATYAATDRLLRHVVPFAQRLGYWTLITADHGMHTEPDAPKPGVHGGAELVDTLVPLWLVPGAG